MGISPFRAIQCRATELHNGYKEKLPFKEMRETSVTVTLDAAKHILYAKALETAPSWDRAVSANVSKRTAHRLGESASAGTYLAERAKSLCEEEAKEKSAFLLTEKKGSSFKLVAGLFFIFSFALGLLTEKLTATGNFINLLSFPFWGVIAWNLLIYLVLFLSMIGLLDKRLFPIRQMLTSLRKSHVPALFTRDPEKAQYQSELLKLLGNVFRRETAALLHLSAIAFALGLIASIGLRGLSTAFVVGWESTWFAENAAAVKTFIDFTFGLVPSMGPITPLPDLAALDAIRADRLPYLQTPVSAAPWLLRMMVLLAVLVIIPRFLLFLSSLTAAKFSRSHLKLDIGDAYYTEVLKSGKESANLGNLICLTDANSTNSIVGELTHISELWGNAILLERKIDFDAPPFNVAIGQEVPENSLFLVTLDAIRIPEEEITGALFQGIQAAKEKRPDTLCAALLDVRRFAKRTADYPERVKERKDTWLRFTEQYGVKLFFLENAEKDASQIARDLREWASLQTKINQTATTEKS